MPEGLSQFLLWTVIPVFFMFSLERASLAFLIKAPWGKEWVRSQPWMHPNFISRCRYPMGFVSAGLYHLGHITGQSIWFWNHVGIYTFAFWIITDITDGTIARHFDLHTESGESIDPLSDKLLLFPPLFYFAYLGLLQTWVIFLFLLFDMMGQFSRHFITQKAANSFGKAKTFLTVITIVLLTVQTAYFDGPLWGINVPAVTLYGATFLGFFSMFFKIIPNYWYANILSLLNLACGLAGIVLVLAFGAPGLALAAVFVGQFLDLFDGRAADKWGSTPRGELLDDLADGTSFGGTIAILIWFGLGYTPLGAGLAITHFACTVFRLWRFLKEKREQGIETGVTLFSGFPSPAAALVAGTASLLEIPLSAKVGLIILASVLMVSKVPYIHFGRVILPAIPKIFKAILLTSIIVAVMIGFQTGNNQILYWMVLGCASTYMVLGYPWNRKPTAST